MKITPEQRVTLIENLITQRVRKLANTPGASLYNATTTALRDLLDDLKDEAEAARNARRVHEQMRAEMRKEFK
jgi:hypothetical protein